MNLVIDASVLIKAYVPENLSDKADDLFDDIVKNEIILLAPDLIYPETGNILWKKHRLKELTISEVKKISEEIISLPIKIEPSISLIQLAIDIGISHNITVYDAIYISLAAIYKTKLITADKRLVDAISGGTFRKHVEWLGK